ncbi:MAG: cytidylyltransferase domain-containing protein [bacterium]
MTNLAIVPARSGSKGVPDKNIRELKGTPLLSISIQDGLGAEHIDRVMLSTDSEQYAEIGRDAGAEVPFLRPDDLAGDDSPVVNAVVYTLETISEPIDNIATITLLEPTSPFRKPHHIDSALQQLSEKDYNSVVSVEPVTRMPENIFVKNEEGLERYIKEPQNRHTHRQEMDHLCRINSAVWSVGTDIFMRERDLSPDPIGYVEMKPEESVNINTPLDFKVAEALADEQLS